jgi:hypothetical protein
MKKKGIKVGTYFSILSLKGIKPDSTTIISLKIAFTKVTMQMLCIYIYMKLALINRGP